MRAIWAGLLVGLAARSSSAAVDGPLAGAPWQELQQWPGGTEGIVSPPGVPAARGREAFDPDTDEVLPAHRVVAYYGIPRAHAAGPAYELNDQMLQRLRAQAAAYEQADPSKPVVMGIDLVANIADGRPGSSGNYDHDVGDATLDAYTRFCAENHLLLFLDLELGRNPIRRVLPSYLPYLRRYSFIHLALDPEWTFGSGNGVPGVNYGSIAPEDVNYAIDQLARIEGMPKKILIIHQFRPSVLPGKERIDRSNPRVSVVLHVDSVGKFAGGAAAKRAEYAQWVGREWTGLGGFKLFYDLERPYHLMTPQEVLSLTPPPLIVTYGN